MEGPDLRKEACLALLPLCIGAFSSSANDSGPHTAASGPLCASPHPSGASKAWLGRVWEGGCLSRRGLCQAHSVPQRRAALIILVETVISTLLPHCVLLHPLRPSLSLALRGGSCQLPRERNRHRGGQWLDEATGQGVVELGLKPIRPSSQSPHSTGWGLTCDDAGPAHGVRFHFHTPGRVSQVIMRRALLVAPSPLTVPCSALPSQTFLAQNPHRTALGYGAHFTDWETEAWGGSTGGCPKDCASELLVDA